jgi:hypothetical protein
MQGGWTCGIAMSALSHLAVCLPRPLNGDCDCSGWAEYSARLRGLGRARVSQAQGYPGRIPPGEARHLQPLVPPVPPLMLDWAFASSLTSALFILNLLFRPFVVAHTTVIKRQTSTNTFGVNRYAITGLKSLARAKFAAQVAHHYDSPEFADALFEVYDTTVDTDRGLRDIVIQAFREHPELAQSKEVEPAIKETPGLAVELFKVGWGLPVY